MRSLQTVEAEITPGMSWLQRVLGRLSESGRDLLPIIVVIAFFQLVVLRQPLPQLGQMLGGLALVVIGLTFFIRGIELGLFPIGEAMAHSLASKGSLFWLVAFAFALGFGTTAAEPALIAIADEAAQVAANAGVIGSGQEAMDTYAFGLRLTYRSRGRLLPVRRWRIPKGWPICTTWIAGGYVIVMIVTVFAPREITGMAHDSVRPPRPRHHGSAGYWARCGACTIEQPETPIVDDPV